jgi:hypothetical protein
MKTTLMFAIAVFGLGIHQGQAGAQGKIKPAPLALKASLSAKDQLKIPEPLAIDQFYARRDPQAVPPRIRVAGVYRNSTFRTVTGATFSIDRWNGSGWTSLKSGPLNAIASGKSGAESLTLPPSRDAAKFRFVVSKSVQGSVEFTLPRQELIGVRYRSVEWQQKAFGHKNNELIGKRARDFQNHLKSLGFETKIEYSSFAGWPFGSILGSMTYHQWVDYRLLDWREKTFETRTEAIQFHSSLPDGAVREIVAR